MKKERTLSYTLSQKLTQEEIKQISAAGVKAGHSGGLSYDPQTGWDVDLDLQ